MIQTYAKSPNPQMCAPMIFDALNLVLIPTKNIYIVVRSIYMGISYAYHAYGMPTYNPLPMLHSLDNVMLNQVTCIRELILICAYLR